MGEGSSGVTTALRDSPNCVTIRGTVGAPGYLVLALAYLIARDLEGGWRYCDVPAYRYQCILNHWLGTLALLVNESQLPA
jgi:hypothetical protein